ncbi:aminotransferase class III-fold pyridoxal phosphate-dependent enzyme [Candidatus Methylospira mobilis]|nr:aminotransferase class III-fold pyridoxal phosphate-dependent enzyme [Candidatus Methylospira mobilis]WNV03782.1 aminotransferase class III-fold pyridoxal phosphate-dependent enzyme [Candidatus Methylospira mobilis]
MLLAKRPESFLPDLWPAYFSKAKGCRVWDMDGNEYIDMSIMGIGAHLLGYGHPAVDEAVCKVIADGNMSTLNGPEEVYLAEKLIELHPWADMARFARTGSDANAVAIRIARAASGRDKVAFCGFHGWHDWYMSASHDDKDCLAQQFLPGLEPNGIPKTLSGTALPFVYNDYASLETLVQQHDIGAIKLEIARHTEPQDGFLHQVRKLASERGIVLIFDECTSGFRETLGGVHKRYDVEPDMALFGKTLGNGYAISAILGKRQIMEAAQTSLISSTFWTDRIGPAAALKTLEIMEQTAPWDAVIRTGFEIRQGWQHLADKYDVPIRHWGLPSMARINFPCTNNGLAYKTLITQEMLARGYLAANSVFVCIEHRPDIIAGFFEALDPVFALIGECEHGRDVTALLKGPVCHGSFKRVN